MSQALQHVKRFLLDHWLAIVLVAVGSWLRTTQLPEKGILFGDSGRDLLVAASAVENHELPLLGIPSSVPRFKQGPLTIWLSMGIYQLFGYEPLAFYWAFALIGCLSLIAIYEFSILTLTKKTGLIALSLLATSPLAVAHSRMPYHTVPIILTTILALYTLTLVYQRKKWSLAWATFAVSLVFQHELSLFPLFLAIPICWWWGGQAKDQNIWAAMKFKSSEIGQILLAGIVGLTPQILSEVRDNSHQLSGFVLWLGYRVASFFIPGSQHFGASTFLNSLSSNLMYWQKIFLIPAGAFTVGLVIVLAIFTFIGWLKLLKQVGGIKKLSPGQIVILLATGLITLGYLMHGAPSEAYFPVYAALLPLIAAIGLIQIKSPFSWMRTGLVMSICLTAIWGIYQNNFWVDKLSAWNYGPSFQTQVRSLTWAQSTTKMTNFSLNSQDSDAQFKHYLDNYVWVGKSLGLNLTSKTGEMKQTQLSDITISHSKIKVGENNYFTSFHVGSKRNFVDSVLILPTTLVRYNPD